MEENLKIPNHVAIILDGNGVGPRQKECPATTVMCRGPKR